MEAGATATTGLHHGTDLETTAMQHKTITRALAGAYRYALSTGPVLIPVLAVTALVEVLL